MIRSTTSGVLLGYRTNLMGSFTTLNKSRDTVLSQRIFNSYAEDPAAAAKAFRLRRSRMAVQSQYDITDSTYRKYQVGWKALDSVGSVLDTTTKNSIKNADLQDLNDPTGDARKTLSTVLSELSDTILQNMNQKYGDNFVFAGADGSNVPFEIRQVDGKDHIFYRGIDVDTEVPKLVTDDATKEPIGVDANGNLSTTNPTHYLKSRGTSVVSKDEYAKLYTLPTVAEDGNGNKIEYNTDGTVYDPTDPDQEGGFYLDTTTNKTTSIIGYNQTEERIKNKPPFLSDAANPTTMVEVDENGNYKPGGGYYLQTEGAESAISKEDYDKAVCDLEKLDYLAGEKYFVDIGLGFEENEDGQLIESSAFNASLIGLTFLGYGVDEDGDPKNIVSLVKRMSDLTNSDGPFDGDTFQRLTQKLEKASAKLKVEYSGMDAESTKLKTNMELLEGNFDTLQEQYSGLEDVDMADSITSFVWAQYCYNAALKVGNSILSQSLIDYMN